MFLFTIFVDRNSEGRLDIEGIKILLELGLARGSVVRIIKALQLVLGKLRAQVHGSAYRKQRIGTYGSGELRKLTSGKRISRVSRKYMLVHVHAPRY